MDLSKYIKFLEINVRHDYYDHIVPVDVVFQNYSFVKKYELILQKRQNQWNIFGSESKIADFKSAVQILSFKFSSDMKTTDDSDDSALNFIIRPLDHIVSGITSSLETENFPNNGTVNLQLNSVWKYYEVIIICKTIDIDPNKIQIIDYSKNIELNKYKIIINENGEKAIHFQSTHKFKLIKKAPYNLSIVSKSESGDRILINNLRLPEPENVSSAGPCETITAFFYI